MTILFSKINFTTKQPTCSLFPDRVVLGASDQPADGGNSLALLDGDLVGVFTVRNVAEGAARVQLNLLVRVVEQPDQWRYSTLD